MDPCRTDSTAGSGEAEPRGGPSSEPIATTQPSARSRLTTPAPSSSSSSRPKSRRWSPATLNLRRSSSASKRSPAVRFHPSSSRARSACDPDSLSSAPSSARRLLPDRLSASSAASPERLPDASSSGPARNSAPRSPAADTSIHLTSYRRSSIPVAGSAARVARLSVKPAMSPSSSPVSPYIRRSAFRVSPAPSRRTARQTSRSGSGPRSEIRSQPSGSHAVASSRSSAAPASTCVQASRSAGCARRPEPPDPPGSATSPTASRGPDQSPAKPRNDGP